MQKLGLNETKLSIRLLLLSTQKLLQKKKSWNFRESTETTYLYFFDFKGLFYLQNNKENSLFFCIVLYCCCCWSAQNWILIQSKQRLRYILRNICFCYSIFLTFEWWWSKKSRKKLRKNCLVIKDMTFGMRTYRLWRINHLKQLRIAQVSQLAARSR